MVWGDIAPGASLARSLGPKELNFAGAGAEHEPKPMLFESSYTGGSDHEFLTGNP
jgi:hypothetical protein